MFNQTQPARYLKNSVPVSLEKDFYFSDPEYAAMRETSCVERPLAFLFRYFFAQPWVPLLFWDRNQFTYEKNELRSLGSDFSNFFLENQIFEWKTPTPVTLTCDLVESLASEHQALVLIKETKIAQFEFANSLIVEGSGSGGALVTSLRGDDFYVRRSMDRCELKSFFGEAVSREYATIRFLEAWTRESNSVQWFNSQRNCVGGFLAHCASRFDSQKAQNPTGANALQGFLRNAENSDFHALKSAVQDGVGTVLLSRFLWPMTFQVMPFLYFLESACKNFQPLLAEVRLDVGSLLELCLKLRSDASVATNVGVLFASAPTEANLRRFFRSLQNFVGAFDTLEDTIFSQKKVSECFLPSQLGRSQRVLLVDHGPASSAVLNALNDDGWQVQLVSSSRDPDISLQRHFPVKSFAHSEKWLDDDLIAEARKNIPIGVTTFCEHTLEAVSLVAKALQIAGSPDLGLAKICRNKCLFKDAMKASGIAVPRGIFIPDTSDWKSEIANQGIPAFPVIVKSNLGFASAGTRKVCNLEELSRALRRVRMLNAALFSATTDQQTGTLIEEFLSGEEVAIDALVCEGRAFVFGAAERTFPASGGFQDYGYVYFANHQESLRLELEEQVQSVANALRLQNGPLHLEFRRNKNSESGWAILECAPRVGGGGSLGSAIRAATGLNYCSLAIACGLGRVRPATLDSVLSSLWLNAKDSAFFVPEAGEGGIVARYLGVEALRADPRVVHFNLVRDEGKLLQPYPNGADYPAIVVLSCSREESILEAIQSVAETFGVEYEKY
jgi:biotin carboxylase